MKRSNPAPHGGRHQRAKAAGSGDQPGSAQGTLGAGPGKGHFDWTLAFHLCQKWACGEVSAKVVQDLAHKAYVDQITMLNGLGCSPDVASQSLHRLARLGNWGTDVSNIHSQLLSYLGSPAAPLPPATHCDSRCRRPRQAGWLAQLRWTCLSCCHTWCSAGTTTMTRPRSKNSSWAAWTPEVTSKASGQR